jgi:uncharacterized protein (UPF0333 family)
MVDFLGKKGQLSLEFLLILTVVLLLLQIVVVPMRDNAENNLDSFTKITYLDKSMHEIKSNVMKLSNVSEGRLKANIYVPEDSNIFFGDQNVSFRSKIDVNAEQCPNRICQKEVSLPIAITSNYPSLTQGRYVLVFEKTTDVDINIEKIN